jgi:UPF0755 protein
MKKLVSIAALAVILAGILAWTAWERYRQFLLTPLDLPAQGQVFLLPSGATGTDIVEQLSRLNLTRPGWKWKLLMRLEPHVYRAGEYQLLPGMTPPAILGKLASGDVMQYKFTVLEGWTFRQLADALAAHPVLEHDFDLRHPSQWPAVSTELDIDHPEGWFLPETYQFTRGDSELDILRRSHAAMKEVLNQAWEARVEDLPLESPYQLLIMASIIEKETAVDEEREQIAGVFSRRLKKRMRLQTDPTVIYGMGESFDGDIRRGDLKADTPYNTYTRHGLPPTPIAMPGSASVFAAARPAKGEALYFVADGSGGHTFSVTLEEHQAAVRKLIGKD